MPFLISNIYGRRRVVSYLDHCQGHIQPLCGHAFPALILYLCRYLFPINYLCHVRFLISILVIYSIL